MSFVREQDDLRREVAFGASATLVYWPKVDGSNVQIDADSASVALFDSGGTSLGSLSVNAADVGDPEVSRLDITAPSSLALGEDYQVEVSYQVGAVVKRDTFSFDCVLYPIAQAALISLNDLAEVRPDVLEILDRQGRRLGFTDDGVSMAGIYATRALIELDARLRDLIRTENGTRPALLVNRERLLRPLKYTAMRMVYEAESSNPTEDGTDEASGLARHYRAEADMAWRGVGPLRFRSEAASTPDAGSTRGDHRVKRLTRASW